MSKSLVKPRTKVRPKTQRPLLHKVILLNDDYTPREFVVKIPPPPEIPADEKKDEAKKGDAPSADGVKK